MFLVLFCLFLQLCHQNEVESRAIDAVFVEKQRAEVELNKLETALEQEKQRADTLIESMVRCLK